MGVGEQKTHRDVVAFYALTAFAALMYALPQAWIAGLESLRLALITSGLAAGLMVVRRVWCAEPLHFDGIRGLCLLAFCALSFASLAWTVNSEETRTTAWDLLKLAAIYLTLVNVVTTTRRLAVVCGAMVLASLATSYGVIEMHFNGTPEELVEGYRAGWIEVYADPNRAAMNIGLIIPLAVAFVARKESSWLWRAACVAAVAMAVVAIVFTYSRGGFLGLAVAMTVWALREQKKLRSVMLGSVLAMGLAIFAPQSFWERNETVTSFHEDASAMGRVYAWQVASRISLDRPLLGVGAGAFRFAWPLYAPPEATRAYVAHNIFLDVIGELGWVGLLFFLTFVSSATAGAFAASRHRDVGWLARALAASLAGYLVCNVFSGYILSAHLHVYFGLAACAWRIAQRQEATEPVPGRVPRAQGFGWAQLGGGPNHAA
jgi:probable O-glycosylation ligase (exosortase A-associated)